MADEKAECSSADTLGWSSDGNPLEVDSETLAAKIVGDEIAHRVLSDERSMIKWS